MYSLSLDLYLSLLVFHHTPLFLKLHSAIRLLGWLYPCHDWQIVSSISFSFYILHAYRKYYISRFHFSNKHRFVWSLCIIIFSSLYCCPDQETLLSSLIVVSLSYWKASGISIPAFTIPSLIFTRKQKVPICCCDIVKSNYTKHWPIARVMRIKLHVAVLVMFWLIGSLNASRSRLRKMQDIEWYT